LVKSSVKEEKKTLLPKPDLNLNEDESHAIAGEGGIRNDTLLGISLLSKHSLPDLLPAEYLEDTEPQNLMLSEEIPRKKAKKTKFQQTEEKEPKDRRIGTTTYRVTKASSANLAPKSSSQARNTKESWLQGRSGKSVSTNRKSFTKGFFKK
jgi:U3 small nucleolar RNA-associated protein 16